MLLSTFELLLKKITPNPGTVPDSDRSLLQGYFLTVANPNSTNLRIRLRFNATTPQLNPAQLLNILDVNGSNNFAGALVADGANRFRYDFTLPAGDTGLFILQPNILTLNPGVDEVEVRGFVEIFIVVPFFGQARPLLVTPEHRGTFIGSGRTRNDFDQLICPLPISTGAGLMTVDTVSSFALPPVFPPLEPALPRPFPVSPIAADQLDRAALDPSQVSAEQVLNAMAERIASLEASLTANSQN